MRKKSLYLVVTFHTTADAVKTEQICKANNLDGKLISAPRSLSEDCGIAWRGPVESGDALAALLTAGDVDPAGFHEVLM